MDIEEKIIRAVIGVALSTPTVSVAVKEFLPIKQATRDVETVMSNIFLTGYSTIYFVRDGHMVGWVWFVHGNGEDVISDYSDNPFTVAVVEAATMQCELP